MLQVSKEKWTPEKFSRGKPKYKLKPEMEEEHEKKKWRSRRMMRSRGRGESNRRMSSRSELIRASTVVSTSVAL